MEDLVLDKSGGIWNPRLWNPEYNSRNLDPNDDRNPESIPGIRNPRRGIQITSLSSIFFSWGDKYVYLARTGM